METVTPGIMATAETTETEILEIMATVETAITEIMAMEMVMTEATV